MRTVYRARQVRTFDAGAPDANAVLAEDGQVLAACGAAGFSAGTARVADFGDVVLTPGLAGGHSHPVPGPDLTDGAGLTDALTLEAARELPAQQRDRLSPGNWLKGWGLNPRVSRSSAPTAAALGPASGGIPGYVRLYGQAWPRTPRSSALTSRICPPEISGRHRPTRRGSAAKSAASGSNAFARQRRRARTRAA